jgi:hypothetical protein
MMALIMMDNAIAQKRIASRRAARAQMNFFEKVASTEIWTRQEQVTTWR